MSKYNETTFSDPALLEEQVEAYFRHCEESKKVYELKNGDVKIRQEFPTMTGLAVWLRCSRETLYSYINQDDKPDSLDRETIKKLSDTLSYARNRIAMSLSQTSMSGDADPKIAGLLLNAMGETTPEVQATVNVVIQGDSDAYSV